MADCGNCYREDICSHRYSTPDGNPCKEYFKAGEWIPCSEQMPDINYQQKALIVTTEFNGQRFIRTASYHELKGMPKHWRCGGSSMPVENVIAWMPFPLPYED